MSSYTTPERAPRSTRNMLTDAERHQSLVIAALVASNHHHIAGRLTRCQRERLCREDGWPWRCRSAGCWQCRRTMMGKWWRAFHTWLGKDDDVSFAMSPLTGDLISTVKRLRKSLRDVRDRAGRHDHRWRMVAFGGLADGDRLLILIQHRGIDRDEIWATLERRWPEIVLGDPGNIEPASAMTVANAAVLARRRRGIEPLRIVIMPQIVTSSAEGWDDQPMPIVF